MLNLRGVGSLQEAIGRSSAGSKFAKRAEGSISSAKRPRVSDYLGGHNAGETDAAAAAVAGGTPRSPCQQDPTKATAPASCIASLPDPDRAHAKAEELDTAAAAAVLKAASAAAEGPYADMARGSSRDGPPKQGWQQQQQQQHQRWTQSTATVCIETLCVGMQHHRHHHRQQDSASKVMAAALRPAGMTVHGRGGGHAAEDSDVMAAAPSPPLQPVAAGGGGGHAAEDSDVMAAAPSPPLQPVRAAGEGDGNAVDDGAAWAVTALRREPCNPYDSNAILVSGGIGALRRLSGLEGG